MDPRESRSTPESGPNLLLIHVENRPNPLESLHSDAEDQGLRVVSQATKLPQVRAAAFEWIEVTTFAIFLLTPLYNDLYHWAKSRIPALWHHFFDNSNPARIKVTKVGRDTSLQEVYSSTLSAWAPFRYGRVKLLFPIDCTEDQFERAIHAYLDAMSAYADGHTYQDIDFDTELDCYFGVILVTYDTTNDCLRVVNPLSGQPADVIANQRRWEQQRRSKD